EAIPLQVVRRDPRKETANVELTLHQGKTLLAKTKLRLQLHAALSLPPAVTRRLGPGRYLLRPASPGHQSYPPALHIPPPPLPPHVLRRAPPRHPPDPPGPPPGEAGLHPRPPPRRRRPRLPPRDRPPRR